MKKFQITDRATQIYCEIDADDPQEAMIQFLAMSHCGRSVVLMKEKKCLTQNGWWYDIEEL